MTKVLITESYLEDIADSIRAKNGTQNTYKPSEMASAIDDISGGGITPTGTKEISITQNGTTTEDVTSYANAEITVSVSGGGGTDYLEELLKKTLTTYTNNNLTSLSLQYAFFSSSVTKVTFPNVTGAVPSNFFQNSKLASIDAGDLPLITKMEANSCNNCTDLVTVVLPSVKNLDNNAFVSCSNLEVCDFGEGSGTGRYIGQSVFSGCAKLDTIILRSPSVFPLNNVNAFNNTPFKSGGTGGTIYIPKSLYDHLGDGTSSDYQSAGNWSTVYGYGTITWAKIEGSQYENTYADGTSIS